MQQLIQQCQSSVRYAELVYKTSQRDLLLKLCQVRHIQTSSGSDTVVYVVKQLQLSISQATMDYLISQDKFKYITAFYLLYARCSKQHFDKNVLLGYLKDFRKIQVDGKITTIDQFCFLLLKEKQIGCIEFEFLVQ